MNQFDKDDDNPARFALVGLCLATLLSSLGTSIANVALPALVEAFAASFQAVQWVVLAYLLAITATIVGVGRLGDRVGRRRLLRAGLRVFTGAAVVGGLAPTLWLVIAARAAQGLGAAVMLALALAFVGEVVPKARLGRAMGLLGTMSAIGTMLGPSLGGGLIELLGWRAIFMVHVPLGLIATVIVQRTLPADRPTPAGQVGFDHVGTSLLALTLAAYALAMTPGRGHFGVVQVGLLLAAAIGAVLFVRVQRRAAAPLLRLAMFRDPALSASLVANLLVATVMMATLVVGPFYLARGLGLGAGAVGIVLSIGPIVAALVGIPAGRLVDRFGAQRMTLAGLAGIAVGCGLLSVAPAAPGIPGYLGPIVAVTAAYALFQAANNTAVMRGVSPDQRGVVSGTLHLSRNLGLITGASVMGAVFALGVGGEDIAAASPAAVAAGMRITFAVAAALIVLALIVVIGVTGVRTFVARRSRRPIQLLALVVAFMAGPGAAGAQAPERGFVVRSADGVNSLRVLGLFQPQFAHDRIDGSAEHGGFFVNRARVGLLGSVFSKDLNYTFVAEFAGGKPRLLFLNIDYTLVPGRLTIRAGQFKRPFSRSFIALASQLSMIDRPLTVGPAAFGDDVDIGVMLHNGDTGRFEYSLGVFNGTGPGVTPTRVQPLLAARIGYNSRGLGPYRESDLEGGAPRFGVAAAAIVDLDADRDHASFTSGLVDVSFKARGFSLTAAVHAGTRQDGPRWGMQRLAAVGHYTQIGHVIAGRFEPVVRYAYLWPRGGEAQHDVAGGLNVFFRGHAFKWQNFVSVRATPHAGRDAPDIRLQSQLTLAF